MTEEKQMLSEADLAIRWDRTERTIRMWRKKKLIPEPAIIGVDTVRWRLEDIKNYEASKIQGEEK